MLIYIIRHGETDYNVVGRLQGGLDIPLNEKGRELARITGEGLRGVRFDLAISSPLSRAMETAGILLESSGNEDVELLCEERIREISFGEWEGKNCTREKAEIPMEEYRLFFSDPFAMQPFPGGESAREVCARTGAFFQELIQNPLYQDKTILISTHGCAMRALLNQVYEDKDNFWHTHVPFNCAVNIVEVRDGSPILLKEDKIYYDPKLCIERYK